MDARNSRFIAMTKRPFNTDEPIAVFITWTTYGTWLPGDDRGWHRRGEGGIKPPNELMKTSAQSEMKESPFKQTKADRAIVEDTVNRHCDIRGWKLHAVNARSNHVHVVVTASGYKPETVRDQFKAWCTRNLKPIYSDRERFWTEGGSCRRINSEEDLVAAIKYTLDVQDRKGLG